MKIRSLIVATTILAAGTGFAFAQSGPSPANQKSSGATTQAPTDQSIAAENGNPKSKSSGHMGTTGAGSGASMGASGSMGAGSARGESKMKHTSPGSQGVGSGIEKEK